MYCGGTWGFVREDMGPERALLALHDEPELVREMTPIEEGQPDVFDLLLGTLGALSDGHEVEMTLLLFEARLLGLAGYAPNVSACAACGTEELKGRSVAFSPLLGGALCRECRGQDPKCAGVPRSALAALGELANGSGRESAAELPARMVAVLHKLLKATFAHNLGHEPKLMRYV